jgi:hypothetical protein
MKYIFACESCGEEFSPDPINWNEPEHSAWFAEILADHREMDECDGSFRVTREQED